MKRLSKIRGYCLMLDKPCLRLVSFEHTKTNINIYKEDRTSTHASPSRTSLYLQYFLASRRAKSTHKLTVGSNTQKDRKSITLYVSVGISLFAIFQFIPCFLTLAAPLEFKNFSFKYRTCKLCAFLMRVPDLCYQWE